MLTTTLKKIKARSPCRDGWEKLLRGLDKTRADDEPLPYAKIVEINGIADALWACTAELGYAKEWRLFAVACARDALRFTDDWRAVNAVNVAERYAHGMASRAQLKSAAASAASAAASASDAYAAYAAYAAAAASYASDAYAAYAAYAAAAASAASYASDAYAAYAAYAAAAAAAYARQTKMFLQIVS
jgi:hypothetical protein